MLVAGKGHEKTQIIGNKKNYFSDKKIILQAIKRKNLNLSDNLKLNILNELSESKKPLLVETINKARIDSREVSKGDIFFAIKGKKMMEINTSASLLKKGINSSQQIISIKNFLIENK